MKNLKDIDTVAHHWANRVGEAGKASSLYFQGDTLVSYAEPIARLLGDRYVMHTTQSWSVTTSNHQSKARQAARHKATLWCRRVQDSPAENMRYARDYIATLLTRAKMAYAVKKDGTQTVASDKKQAGLRADALRAADNANAYLTACQEHDLGIGEPLIDTANLEGVRADLERREEDKRQLIAAERQKKLEAATDAIAGWKRGEPLPAGVNLYGLPVLLRLHSHRPSQARNLDGQVIDAADPDKQVIQTSHGAEIPLDAAIKLWPMVLKVKERGKAVKGANYRLGVYHLNEIRADGSIVVGCHDIPFDELEGIAQQLGLLEAA